MQIIFTNSEKLLHRKFKIGMNCSLILNNNFRNNMKPIGICIEEVVATKGIKQAFFADQINTSERNSYNIFKKESIDTDKLMTICKVLNYDFFSLFSQELVAHGVVEEPEALNGKNGRKKRKIFIEVEVSDKEYKDLIAKRI